MKNEANVVDSEVVDGQVELAPTPQPISALVSRGEAEVAIEMAMRFPRDEDRAVQRLIRACQRSAFAARAEYAFPRGGKTISGPSIYFAREAAKLWGNIRSGFRVVGDTDTERTIRAYAIDLETNYGTEAEDTFKKLIQRRQGRDESVWVVPDERDLRELTNKRAAILLRNVLLAVIPEDVKGSALEIAKATRSNRDSKDPDQARRDILVAFDSLNVTSDELAEFLGCPVGQASPAQLEKLRGIYVAVRDGVRTWREILNEQLSTGNSDPDRATVTPPLSGVREKPAT